MQDNPLKTLYQSLRDNNYDVPDNYESFERTLAPNTPEAHNARRTLYLSLRENNYDVPDNYDSFSRTLFPKTEETEQQPQETTPQQPSLTATTTQQYAQGGVYPPSAGTRNQTTLREQRQQAAQTPTQPTQAPTEQAAPTEQQPVAAPAEQAEQPELTPFQRRVQGLDTQIALSGQAQRFSANMDAMRRNNDPFNPNKATIIGADGKPTDIYRTESGEYVDSYEQQQVANGQYDPESATREQVGELSNAIDTALQQSWDKDVKAYTERHGLDDWGFVQGIAAAAGGKGAATALPTGGEVSQDTRALQAAQRAMRDANRIIAEADKHAQNGDLGQWLDKTWAGRQVHGVGKFVGGSARGVSQNLFDVDNWDFGLTDVIDQKALYDAINAYEKDPTSLTDSQRMLLDAKAVELAVNAYFGSDLGRGYKAGQVTAESIPFMMGFMLNPASGVGKTAQNAMVRYAIKRFGKGLVAQGRKGLAKGLTFATKVGTRGLANTGAALAMTATTDAGHTAANALDRMTGDLHFDTDATGRATFAGADNRMSAGEAVRDAIRTTAIQDFMEMSGDAFAPIFGLLGKGIGKIVTSKAGAHIGLNNVADLFNKVSTSNIGRLIGEVEQRAQWNGVWSEYFEEVGDNVLNGMFVGDMTFDTDPETGIFNLSNNFDTFLGVAELGAAFSAIKTLGFAAERQKLRVAKRDIDNAGSSLFGDGWEQIKNGIDNGSDSDVRDLLTGIMANGDYTEQQKRAAAEYARVEFMRRGVRMAEEKAAQEQAAEGNPQAAEHLRGYDADEQGRRDIAIELAQAAEGTPEHDAAQAAWDGVVEKIYEQADKIAMTNRTINKDITNDDGGIHPVVLKDLDKDGNKKRGYIISGNVVLNPDGTIDPEKSDNSIIIFDEDDHEKKMIDPAGGLGISEVREVISAEAVEQNIQRNQQRYIQDAINDAQGKVNIAVGMPFTIPESGVQGTVTAIEGDNAVLTLADGSTTSVSISAMQQAADEKALADYQARHQQQTEQPAFPAPKPILTAGHTEGVPADYTEGTEITMLDESGNPVSALITGRGTLGENNVFTPQQGGNIIEYNVGGNVRHMHVDELRGKTIGYLPKTEEAAPVAGTQGVAENATTGTTGTTETPQTPTLSPAEQTLKELTEKFGDRAGKKIAATVADRDAELTKAQNALAKAQEDFDNAPIGKDEKQEAALTQAQAAYDAALAEKTTWDEVNAAYQVVISKTETPTGEQPTGEEAPQTGEQPQAPAEPQGETPKTGEGEAPAKPRKGEKQIAKAIKDYNEAKDGIERANAIQWFRNAVAAGAEATFDEKVFFEKAYAELQAEGYEIVDMVGKPYVEGMKAISTFVVDESLPTGTKIITQVRKPQVNKDGKMVQAAELVVKQSAFESEEDVQNAIEEAQNGNTEAQALLDRMGIEWKKKSEAIVPDMKDDKASDARERGYRMVNGTRVDRQGPTEGITGSETEVDFSTGEKPTKARWKVIESGLVQPSHIGRSRNPLHFISEAQPKERTDAVSDDASDKIAQSILPDRITASTNAYGGAPVVNARGEVIQGNNRAIALRKLADYPEQSAIYKQYLIDHAQDFGLDADAISGMKNPVLVREADVSDSEAIRLGNFKASDLESGGIVRIEAGPTLGKMNEGQINTLMSIMFDTGENSDELTISQLIEANGSKVMELLSNVGAITPTQYTSAFKGGRLTEDARTDLRNLMLENIFKGGQDNLKIAFDNLPVAAQKALVQAVAGDMRLPEEDRLIGNIQNAIMAANEMLSSEFAEGVKTYDEMLKAFERMAAQTSMLDEPINKKYSTLDIAIAARLLTTKQNALKAIFSDYQRYIIGDSANLFEEATKLSREEAILKVFGIKETNYGQQRETTGLADGSGQRGEELGLGERPTEGEQGAAAGERAEGEQGEVGEKPTGIGHWYGTIDEAPSPKGVGRAQRNGLFEDGARAYLSANNEIPTFQLGADEVQGMTYELFAKHYRDIVGDYQFGKDEPYLQEFYDYFNRKMEEAVKTKEGEKPTGKQGEKAEEKGEKPFELTLEALEASDLDEVIKSGARAWLNGDKAPANQLAFLAAQDYVRSISTNSERSGSNADTSQLGGTDNGTTPDGTRRLDGDSRQVDSADNGEGISPVGSSREDSAGDVGSSDGEGSDSGLLGAASVGDGGTTTGRAVGSSRGGRKRNNGNRGGKGNSNPVSDGNVRGETSASALEEVDAALKELEDILKEDIKKPIEGKLLAVDPISLYTFLGATKAIKVIAAGAKLAYAVVKLGYREFKGWFGTMKNKLTPLFSSVGMSDEQIDGFIEMMWDYDFTIGNETHKVKEWASILSDAELREQMSLSIEEKRKLQKEAEKTPVVIGDIVNIRENLPFLLPKQQEDVQKAEKQFFDESHADARHGHGKGYMFTNGTGTGKTYTGLGIVKRFLKQGKKRILIVTASETKIKDWIRDAKNLGIDATMLPDISSKGEGVVVTQYANFRKNNKILEDVFDLIVYDESHNLMANQDGSPTVASFAHHMLANRDMRQGARRLVMADGFGAEMSAIKEEYEKLRELTNTPTTEWTDEMQKLYKEVGGNMDSVESRMSELRSKIERAEEEIEKKVDEYLADPKKVEQIQNAVKNTKVVFLSATPFNTPANLDYTEDYIFSYNDRDEAIKEADRMKLRDNFLVENFNSSHRRNPKTHNVSRIPQSGITDPFKASEEEVAFSDRLQTELETMSGRDLDSEYDYSREFPKMDFEIADRFNDAIQSLSDGRFNVLREFFDHLLDDYNTMTGYLEIFKAQMIVPRIREYIDLGKKVTLYHRRKASNMDMYPPFYYAMQKAEQKAASEGGNVQLQTAIKNFKAAYRDLFDWEGSIDYMFPQESILREFMTDKEIAAHEKAVAEWEEESMEKITKLQGEILRLNLQLNNAEGSDVKGILKEIRKKNAEMEKIANKRPKPKSAIVSVFNGDVKPADRLKAVDSFNDDDSSTKVLVVQVQSGKEGISLHDTTGKFPRVQIGIFLPQSPIEFIQTEGRIFRVGNKSNAIFEYPLLGLDIELSNFAQKINGRSETTENLALGSRGRGLKESISRAALASRKISPKDAKGVGGKELDNKKAQQADGFEAAMKNYAEWRGEPIPADFSEVEVPDPIGYAMSKMGRAENGERTLVPNARRGSVARYMPTRSRLTAMETSNKDFARLSALIGGSGRKILSESLKDHSRQNRYDVIVMNTEHGKNPEASGIFDTNSTLDVRDVLEACNHLDISGRLVALVDAKAADDVSKAVRNTPYFRVVSEVKLPAVAMGGHASSIFVIDRIDNKDMRAALGEPQVIDLSSTTDQNTLFAQLREIASPERHIDKKGKIERRLRPLIPQFENTGCLSKSRSGGKMKPDIWLSENFFTVYFTRSKMVWRKADGTNYTSFNINIKDIADGDVSEIQTMCKEWVKLDQFLNMSDEELYDYYDYFTGYKKEKLDPIRDCMRAMSKAIELTLNKTPMQMRNIAEGKVENEVKGSYDLKGFREVFDSLNADDAELEALANRVFNATAQINGLQFKVVDGSAFRSGAGHNVVAHYVPSRNIIELNGDSFNSIRMSDSFKAQTIVHEMIHALTCWALDIYDNELMRNKLTPEQQEACKSIKDVYEQINNDEFRNQLRLNSKMADNAEYGLTNEQEMMAELANPVFRAMLKAKKLWRQLINGVKMLLGIKIPNTEAEESDALTILDNALETLMNTYNPALYEAYTGSPSAMERNMDIPTYDKAESNKLFNGAKKLFGTTRDIREAGYILPDGSMLDFSGRHTLDKGSDDRFLRGRRTSDHREISSIQFEKDGWTETGLKTDMPDFIRRGAIRVDSNAGSINLAVKPTREQKDALIRLIDRNDGDVQVDFGDGWDTDHYAEYTGAKPMRVLNDIDRYFDEGVKPEGNALFRSDNSEPVASYEQRVADARAAGYSESEYRAYIERAWRNMHMAADELIDKLGIADRVVVHETREGLKGKQAKAKGWYDPETGKIHLVMINNRGNVDIVKTILHEAVAHYGLRELFGSRFDTFLDNVYYNTAPNSKEKLAIDEIARRKNINYREATEEYLAELAEDMKYEGVSQGFWQKVRELFYRMMDKLGLSGEYASGINEAELKYLLWRSYKNLTEPNRYINQFKAEDEQMQKKLGVGDYEQDNGEGYNWEAERDAKVAEAEFKKELAEIDKKRNAIYDKITSKNDEFKRKYGENWFTRNDIPKDEYDEYRGFWKEMRELDKQYVSLQENASTYGKVSDSGVLFRQLEDSDTIVDNADAGTKPLTDREKIAKLEAEPKIKVYRSMVLIDGKLYPPMSSKENGDTLRNPSELGKWDEAEEAPEKAVWKNGKWVFMLKKDNGDTVPAAYNPYIHTSDSMMNDQFSSAQSRPNLVVVEMEVPLSELQGNYHAEKALDSVGQKPWHAGPVTGKLTGNRNVVLTRWAKPVRIVPNNEVAKSIFKQIDGQIEVMPTNVVTPQVREELEKLGVKFVETNNQGIITEGKYKGKTWADLYGKKSQGKQQKIDRVEELSKKFGVPISIVERKTDIRSSNKEVQQRRRNAKGWYNLTTGEVVVVLPNNTDVEDVTATVMHEVVAHKGLREIIGKANYDAFLDEVYKHLRGDLKARVDAEVGRNFVDDVLDNGEHSEQYIQHRREAVDELFAAIAEKNKAELNSEERTFWQKVKDLVCKALDKFLGGVKLPEDFELGENELAYMLWRSAKNLERGKESPIEFAEDITERRKRRIIDDNGDTIIPRDTTDDDTDPDGPNGGGSREMAEIERKAKADGTWLKAPNGRPTNLTPRQWVQVRTKAFKNWFGDWEKDPANASKVVDKNGEPLVVYHGTSPGFYTFDISHLGETSGNKGWFGEGFYFATDKGMANGYAKDASEKTGGNPRIIAAFLNVRNPQIIDVHAHDEFKQESGTDGVVATLKLQKGNPYLKERYVYDRNNIIYEVKVNDPNQIKSATENNGDFDPDNDDIRFRDGEDSTTRAIARDTYERMVASSASQFKESVQDSMLSLKHLYQTILEAEGKEDFKIEEVAGYENAYLAENRMHSMSQEQVNVWQHDYMQPLTKAIHELTGGSKKEYDILTDYMMAKHGLERNEVFAKRDADNAAAEKYDRDIEAVERELGDDTDEELVAQLDALRREKEEYAQQQYEKNRTRDYAGLTALTGTDDIDEAEQLAQSMVDEYEEEHDTEHLWDMVNRATRSSLRKIADSGLMSAERYRQVRDMFEYYIPLQGFDETVAEEVYAYMGSDGTLGYGTPIRHAKGRKSKADDPIATISMNGEAAIRKGNRNLMKQRFLNFVRNHPSDLVSVSDVWLRKNDVTGEWEQYFDVDLQETDTPKEVERKVAEFEQRMEELSAEHPDQYKRSSQLPNVPFRVLESTDKAQHQVMAMVNGKPVIMTINGSPRAAQALNGLTNPDVHTGGWLGKAMDLFLRINRQLSALYTTRNPEFVLSNFLRDAVYSNSMTWVKESPAYALSFHKNFGKMNPVTMGRLFSQWENGKLRERITNGTATDTERMFADFMNNGGETGWTSLRDIEKHKRDLEKALKREGNVSRKAWKALGGCFDLMNRSVENCARFAAFVTSREAGRSIERSIWDAKEVSVNFNKKGSNDKYYKAKSQRALGNVGAFIGGAGRSLYVFWNASLQGLNNIGRASKRNPWKAAGLVSTLFTLGAVMPLLSYLIGGDDGDDDDKDSYYNLPEYIRRCNLCFRWSKGMPWITIPLPIEFRAVYGLGELTTGLVTGKERYNDSELAKQYISQVSQVLPLDFMEGGGGFHALIPSQIKPFAEAYTNKGWTGLPIYKKDTLWNEDDPQWTKAYKNANKQIVYATKWLNEATGGDDVKQGWIDWNPARIEYMLKGYLGGPFTMYDRLQKSAETILGDREFEWRNVPMASRVLKEGDERTEARKLQNEYFDLLDEYNKAKHDMKGYQKKVDAGGEDAVKYAEKIDYYNNSKEYAHYQLMQYYEPLLKQYYEMQKDAEGEEKERLKAAENALRRELVNVVHALDDGEDIDIDEAINTMLAGLILNESADLKVRQKAQKVYQTHQQDVAKRSAKQ